MAAYAGAAPWAEGYKRTNKRTQQQAGMEWSLSSGWRQKPADDWQREPKKPKTKTVRLHTGRTVEVPDADYEDYLAFLKRPTSDPDSEVGSYIDGANFSQVKDGIGHIAKLEYAPMRQLLWVTFQPNEQGYGSNDEVVFFRVPAAVYAELAYLAESKSGIIDKKGFTRHNLGIRFWDIIRIRGQRIGARYPFEYAKSGDRKGSQFGQSTDKFLSGEEKKQGATDDIKETLDMIAKGKLTGTQLESYRALKSNKDRMAFMKLHNILE